MSCSCHALAMLQGLHISCEVHMKCCSILRQGYNTRRALWDAMKLRLGPLKTPITPLSEEARRGNGSDPWWLMVTPCFLVLGNEASRPGGFWHPAFTGNLDPDISWPGVWQAWWCTGACSPNLRAANSEPREPRELVRGHGTCEIVDCIGLDLSCWAFTLW